MSTGKIQSEAAEASARAWRYPPALKVRTIGFLLIVLAGLYWSLGRVELDKAGVLSIEAVSAAVGGAQESQVARAVASIGAQMFPLAIAERTELSAMTDFDPRALPPFARIEESTFTVAELNPETLAMETRTERRRVLVEPFGYVLKVAIKLFETLEIALWGAALAVIMALPMALASARPLMPHAIVRTGVRAFVAMLRAIPELISALFLVLAYGFGPAAGVLALALHGAGFLAKIYADDIENAERAAQEALMAIGAGPLKVFRHAIAPQVLPSYVASTLYLLDRNVRMATVIGLVGAGGIGQELKGRFDMYEYSHVGTILVGIFVLVFSLELASGAVRKRLIG